MKKPGDRVASGVVLNTYGTFAYFFCQWLLTVFTARLGGFACAGVFSLSIAFSNLFSYISMWGVRCVQVSDISRSYENGAFSGARLITSALAVLLVPIVLWFYGYTGEVAQCCAAAVVFKLVESITDLNFGTFQRLDRYECIAVSYTLKGVLPAAVFLLTLWWKASLLWAIRGMTLTALMILLCYDALRLRGCGLFQPRFAGAGALLKQCFPLMLYGMVSAWMIYLPRHAVQTISGSEVLGYYGSISTVVVVLSTLGGAIVAAIIPAMSETIQKRDVLRLRQVLRICFAGIGCLAVLALAAGKLLGPWVFSLVYGAEILDYLYLLPPVIINSVLLLLDTFFDSYFVPAGERNVLLWANLAGLLACGMTVTQATERFSALGACCSMMLGLLVRMVVLLVLMLRSLSRMERNGCENGEAHD